ncbi:putative RNA helicase [Cavenderia fasciculata]|uniref:RNA helicase n=1 Tax=Cavenderia fasciculata TaxID=261658 RepID=F4PZR2_CACFS|nr:putative RNA helicase [Cavenderia fasciculata]EGG18826.1 putative RNA helicase [Cavenderia fasciculata]|eukprot:XP_004357288.1 putative RNA helicase [Cavenderia fasciculata]
MVKPSSSSGASVGSSVAKKTTTPKSASRPAPSSSTKKVIKKEESNNNKKKVLEREALDDVISSDEEDDGIDKVENSKLDENTTFDQLGMHPQIIEACVRMGFKKPTEIQRESIPHAIAGRDIIGLAQTGSGKTAAFAIPILQQLLQSPQPLFALILSPTRELAFQISQQFEALGAVIGVKCGVLVGGMDVMQQAMVLARKPHIIVGTPGRVMYHLENTKGFHLKALKFLVMDEADRLLSMDFEEEINKILKVIPKNRNTYLFSATMTSKVAKLQKASLVNPIKVQVASTKYSTVDTLVQQYCFIPYQHKDCYLTYILNELSGNSAIVFVATCAASNRLSVMLRNLGLGAIPINGNMDQTKRLASLNKFKSSVKNILVATDVAARGLDIPSVGLVVNYDIPVNSKEYVHRVGRTARAGQSGRAITLVTQYDVEVYQRIEFALSKKLEEFPSESSSVLVFLEAVNEAARLASLEVKEDTRVMEDSERTGSAYLKKKSVNKKEVKKKKKY